jgi:hypothetical protein
MLEPRQLHATGASPRRTSTKGTLSLHRDCRGSCSLLQRGPRCDSQAAAVKQAERAAGFTSSVHCLRWSPVAPALFCVSVSAHAATEQHQLSLFGFLLRRRPSPEPLTSRAQQQQQPAAVCHLFSRTVRRDGQLGANEAVVRNARAPTSSTSPTERPLTTELAYRRHPHALSSAGLSLCSRGGTPCASASGCVFEDSPPSLFYEAAVDVVRHTAPGTLRNHADSVLDPRSTCCDSRPPLCRCRCCQGERDFVWAHTGGSRW